MKLQSAALLVVALLLVLADPANAARRKRNRRAVARKETAARRLQEHDRDNCMEDNWHDAGNSQGLQCTAKEVYCEQVTTTEPMECTAGTNITVTMEAFVHFNAARYDGGWYVALDGGNAYKGKCAVSGFIDDHKDEYVFSDDLNGAAELKWDKDHKEGDDECGDILMNGGGGGNVKVPFVTDKTLPCIDNDGDGYMDFFACFSWRTKGTDGKCSLTPDDDGITHLYPGTPSKCWCERYNVESIKVTPPGPTYSTSIQVTNKVYNCDDDGASCGTSKAVDAVTGPVGDDITYCFNVTNTGSATLKEVAIQHTDTSLDVVLDGTLGPGDTRTLHVVSTIKDTTGASNDSSTARAIAEPIDETGERVGPAVTGASTTHVTPIYLRRRLQAQTTSAGTCPAGNMAGAPVLGPAGKCTLFQLGTGKIDMAHGDPTGTHGNICMTEGSQVKQSGGQIVSGNIYSEDNTVINIANEYVSGIINQPAVLTTEKQAVYDLRDEIEALPCNQTLELGSELFTMLNHDGPEVICLTKADIKKDLVIHGDGSHPIYFKIDGKRFSFSSTVTTADGLDDCQIIWYIMGGKEVASSGGGGGTGCCKAHLAGTIINLYNKVSLAPGRVTCSVISEYDIKLASGSLVGCDDPTTDATYQDSPTSPDSPDTDSSGDDETCMEDNWADSGKSMSLVCRAKEVYLDSLTKVPETDVECSENEDVVGVDLTASIHFNAARYDAGWYVATDGGDAYSGTCIINGFSKSKNESGLYQPDAAARLSWSEDAKGDPDACGDVMMDGGGGGNVLVPFVEQGTLKCVDKDGDGKLDFGVCFSWRVAGNDNFCTLSKDDPKTAGDYADLYPATPSKCFCTRYNVNSITVKPKAKPDPVSDPSVPDVVYEACLAKPLPEANISIVNKVYIGNDNGSSCSTGEGEDSGVDGTDASFCFTVENTGQTSLKSLEVTNDVLDFSATPAGLLGPGDKKHFYTTKPITADSLNTVTVVATPADQNGEVISDLEPATAEADSKVVLVEPSISVVSKVYVGHDGGLSCDNAGDEVNDFQYTPITFCVVVENDGDTSIDQISVITADISINLNDSVTPFKLAPGEKKTITYQSEIPWCRVTAVFQATGMPVQDNGDSLPNSSHVTASASSSTNTIAIPEPANPVVRIVNQVYVGDDGGKSCSTASDSVEAEQGSQSTFCFTIYNDGNTGLSNIFLVNNDLNPPFQMTLEGRVSPHGMKYVAVPRTITEDKENTITVVANPVDSDGNDLPDVPDVNAADSSSVSVVVPVVDLINYTPAIVITHTCYVGDDSGASCGSPQARTHTEGFLGDTLTHCITFKNDGDSFLNTLLVTVDEPQFSWSIEGNMGPQQSMTVWFTGPLNKDIVSTATVTGNPTDENGQELSTEPDVTASATATADVMVLPELPVPGISIKNVVYLGSDHGMSCSNADEVVEGQAEQFVTYCFALENTGNTYLSNVSITNQELDDYTHTLPDLLAPGQSTSIRKTEKISGTMSNSAVVTANPVNKDGDDLVGVNDVTASDDSSVFLIEVLTEPDQYRPSIQINNTVYIGEDGGDSCGTSKAVDQVQAPEMTNIVYCFAVQNTGNTNLDGVEIINDVLDTTYLAGLLRPQELKTFFHTSEITTDLVNDAVVLANPVGGNGGELQELASVFDSDASSVVKTIALAPSVTINNTVFLGDDNGESCGTDVAQEEVSGISGMTVTYCFEVKNTGNTDLTSLTIDNGDLSFPQDQTIGQLQPQDTAIVAFVSTISGSLQNTATVTATPAMDGNPIADAQTITDTDTSSVVEETVSSAIMIQNTVYLGDVNTPCDDGLGVQKVEDVSGVAVVYCFNVTNTGGTTLKEIMVANQALGMSPDNSIGTLEAGKSQLVAFSDNIDGSLVNTAVVTGKPAAADGTLLNVDEVTSQDTSEVVQKTVDGDVRSGEKTVYSPPDPSSLNCIETNWINANGSDEDLICSTKEVYILSIAAESDTTCEAGESITLTADATMAVKTATAVAYDLGWYVATDGGEAMTGTCVANGLQEGNTYDVTDDLALVDWASDDGDGDMCGDISVDSESGAEMVFPLVVETTIPCTDSNDNGSLDVAICFTWRTEQNNGNECSFASNIPGAATGGCYCTRVEIPNITVMSPTDASEVC